MEENHSVSIIHLTKELVPILEKNFTFNDIDNNEYKSIHPRLHSVIPKKGDLINMFQKTTHGDESCLIAWISDIPVGWLSIRWIGDHDIHRIQHSHPEAKKYHDVPAFYNFWVKSNYRNQGIGHQIMLEAEKIAFKRGCSQIGITVDNINSPAKDLYTNFGFQESKLGLFSTSGKYFKGSTMMEWVNGPMWYMFKNLKNPK